MGLVFLGIFAIEVAKNASGEVFDFDSGADLAVAPEDRSPFSGGKRVLVDALLTRRQTMAISALAYGAAIAVGLIVVLFREPRVLWLGAAGIACAYFYHAPPLRLSYRGLGELAVAVCYGPLIACGTYLVLRNAWSARVLVLSVPLAILIAAFLWINEFPDYKSDKAASKRNLVVRLGRLRASRAFAGMVATAALATAAAPLYTDTAGILLGALAMIPAMAAAWILVRNPESTARVLPAQVLTLVAFVTYALGTGVGLILF